LLAWRGPVPVTHGVLAEREAIGVRSEKCLFDFASLQPEKLAAPY
jgi:hypothetical protein